MKFMKSLINYFVYKWKYKGSVISFGSYIGRNSILQGSNVIHRNCHFFGKLGYGSYIAEGSDINASIGKYCSIGQNVKTIQGRHPIEKFVSTHPVFYSLSKQSGETYVTSQKYEEFMYADFENRYANIVGNDVWIGANVSIIAGVKIGDGSVVLANATVTKDVQPYSIVAGVPAKVIKKRFTDDQIEKLLQLLWWDKPKDWIIEHADEFSDIELLLKNEIIK